MRRAKKAVGFGPNKLMRIARIVRKLIKLIAAGLFAIFAWLHLREIPYSTALENLNPDILRRLTIVIYYWCWVYGSNFDLDLQEGVYVSPGDNPKFPKAALGVILLLAAVAALLLWSAGDDKRFSALLTAFFAVNIGGFVYMIRYVAPIFRESRTFYSSGSHYFSLAQLEIVSDYMNGRWQWFRFATGVIMIFVIDVVCFWDDARSGIGHAIETLFGSTAVSERPVLIPSFLFLLFVLVAEGWIYFMRLKTGISLSAIERLETKFVLMSKRAAAARES